MKAFIFGAGAHGRTLLDILRVLGRHESMEFLDDNEQLWGEQVNGAPILGGLDYALQQDRKTFEMIVALGNSITRLAVAEELKTHSITLLNAIHPSAVVMPSATMGEGNMIAAASVVNSNASVGNHVIINTGAVVEHDCVLADGVNVSPGAQICGRVTLGRMAFVGTGAIILPRISVGPGAVIAAGSIVTHDVPEKALVRGAPARIVEMLDETFDWKRLL
jgi:sugar O-acyltransferase (sialic acid O-acetyltransferase NeuD family)